MFLRRNNKVKAEVSFDEPLNVDWDGNELLLSDVLGTENDLVLKNIEAEVERKLLYSAIEKLSSRERKLWNCALASWGRKRNAEGSGGIIRHFAILYFPPGKKNY